MPDQTGTDWLSLLLPLLLRPKWDENDAGFQAPKTGLPENPDAGFPAPRGPASPALSALAAAIVNQPTPQPSAPEPAPGPDPLIQAIAAMTQKSGGPQQMLSNVDMLRGATEGKPPADLNMAETLPTPREQGIADRYAWGATLAQQKPAVGPLSLLPTIGYEGLKGAAQNFPGLAPALAAAGNFFTRAGGATGKQLGDWFTMGPTSSPASMDNIRALLAGWGSQ